MSGCKLLLIVSLVVIAKCNEGDDTISLFGSVVSYEGVKVFHTTIANEKQMKTVLGLKDVGDIEIWNSARDEKTTVDIMVKNDRVVEVENSFLQSNISYKTMIEDLQQAINEENAPSSYSEFSPQSQPRGHNMTWNSYHRMKDINEYLDYLARTYPDFCNVTLIGRSRQKRPLKVLKITGGETGNPAIWIDGGAHAREWISPAVVTYIAKELTENRAKHKRYVDGIDWYILPVMNPDGYEFSRLKDRMWRKNRAKTSNSRCFGVDLNRNFGFQWGKAGSSGDPCSEIYRGRQAFSEPESSAIKNFITTHSDAMKAYVSFHSYGQYILQPWAYTRRRPQDYDDLYSVGGKVAEAIKNFSRREYTVGSTGSVLYLAAGGSDDWAKGAAKIKYSYTIELRDKGNHGFILPSSYIIPTGKEGLVAMKAIAEAVMNLK